MGRKRNAQAEAQTTVGPEWRPLVLEPSPPADFDEPYMAVDPLADPGGDRVIVTPLSRPDKPGTITWDELVGSEPDLSLFASQRWLAAWPRLQSLPETFAATRVGLHLVAAYIVSPARRRATGKIGLRYTLDGFGTPFFVQESDPVELSSQVRVEGTQLVDQHGEEVREHPLTTLNELGAFLSMAPDVDWAAQFDIPPADDLDDPLVVDPEAAAALADWFGFAFSVLEELRADRESTAATRPQLWPEHFDPAIEIGTDESAQRASYGLSSGDLGPDGVSEPYLYVSAWYPSEMVDDPFWNSESFPGARLNYSDLLDAPDQRLAALEFFTTARSLLLLS